MPKVTSIWKSFVIIASFFCLTVCGNVSANFGESGPNSGLAGDMPEWMQDNWQLENEQILHQMLGIVESAMLTQLGSLECAALSDEEYDRMLGEVSTMRNAITSEDTFYNEDNYLMPNYRDTFEDIIDQLDPFWDFE